MSDEPGDPNQKKKIDPHDSHWESRTLCSDESCIGVIGPDGRCKECGKPYTEPPAGDKNTTQSDTKPVDAIDESPPLHDDDDWKNRTLCSDESCIGVIGPDGRCKECGKAY